MPVAVRCMFPTPKEIRILLPTDRRHFLADSSLLAAATLLPPRLLSQVAISAKPRPIPDYGTLLKFRPDGTPRPFAGNTVICHLPAQCAMRDAMVTLREALSKLSLHTKLGLTSTESYHMTVFPGANDQNRSSYGWPSYVPLDAPIEVCDRMVGERMAKARLRYELPIRLRVDEQATIQNSPACSLRLVAADAAAESNLRSLRDQLAEVYGFRLLDHATYKFHVTMAYQVASFTSEDLAAYQGLLQNYLPKITVSEPVIELGEPEYCTFPDMFRFEPMHLLACS